MKLPNNNVSPAEREQAGIILICLICMQNMTYEAAGCSVKCTTSACSFVGKSLSTEELKWVWSGQVTLHIH